MVITIGPDLEAILSDVASKQGVAPEDLAVSVLRDRFLISQFEPRDEWEQGLLKATRSCGVSLPNLALGSEGLYD
ncbi:MAG: hypothetical protein U1E05_27825 [Patescibacteria group bacterium]|nr:hypothetical protein [Patescibacteria group bacterium]